jgi:tagatose-1,6-bisphosphate aldolase non-catalytic subunit AgaZ/GatZ
MYQKPEDWHSLFEAVTLDFPLSMQRLLLGADEAGVELEQAASKAHHAWVNLASAMVNTLYVRTGFWDFVLDNFNGAMRIQRLAQAAARVVVASFGPTIGLASTADVDALQDELSRLRRDLKLLNEQLLYQTSAGGLRRVK